MTKASDRPMIFPFTTSTATAVVIDGWRFDTYVLAALDGTIPNCTPRAKR